MKFDKIIGYFLLFLGLSIIIWSIYVSYGIFTGQSLPPSVFEIEEKEETVEGTPDQIEQLIESQLSEIISSEEISKVLNLTTWLMLAGILIFGGGKISSIGIGLIKE